MPISAMIKSNMVDWTTQLQNGFNLALSVVLDEETSRLSLDQDDCGNWTSGVVGEGALNGTKYGISAASYPSVNIAALSYSDAVAIYQRDYAARIQFNNVPTILGTIMLDAAVNNGVSQANKWLQQLLEVEQDGDFGDITLGALNHRINRLSSNVLSLCAQFSHLRLSMMSELPNWKTNGGWARRLAYLPYRAVAVLTISTAKASNAQV